MHIRRVNLHPDQYPTREYYPFNQPIFHKTRGVDFPSAVTFFVGENGTGKSTLLEAITNHCGIHIWRDPARTRLEVNPYEKALHRFISVDWTNGPVPGSFFASDIFRDFTHSLDEWATSDPGSLKYFGGKSLVTQSHGQSMMSYFQARYQIKGLYLLDEPETALSPRTQLALLKLLREMSRDGHAQFIIATHSPILLALPESTIYSFDHVPLKRISYEQTEHYQIYRRFIKEQEIHHDHN